VFTSQLLASAEVNAQTSDVDAVCLSGMDFVAFVNRREPKVTVLQRFRLKS